MHFVEIPNMKLLHFSVVISWLHRITVWGPRFPLHWVLHHCWPMPCLEGMSEHAGAIDTELRLTARRAGRDVSQGCTGFRKAEPAWSGGAWGACSMTWAGCSSPWEWPSRAVQTWLNSLSNSDFLFKAVNNHTQKQEAEKELEHLLREKSLVSKNIQGQRKKKRQV